MQIVNRRLNLREFQEYVARYDFGLRPPEKLVIHHTWRPTVEQWRGEASIVGLKGYYERKGWPAGPHLFVAEDGIWLFSPMRHNGIHAGPLNAGSVGIEVVGDYDQTVWARNTKNLALGAISVLMQRLLIPLEQLYFHRDVSPKTCPGRAITKEWLKQELSQHIPRPMIPLRSFRDAVEHLSAPAPAVLEVPGWGREAVDFIKRHDLFGIRTEADVRDAVKFYRFYQFIQSSHD